MIPNMTRSRSLRSALAGLVCCATWGAPSLAFAQDARPADVPEAAPRADSKDADAAESDDQGPERVYKTDAEWRKLLTYNQYLVTRMKATEPAFSGKYAHGHPKGTFLCVCCGAKLFDSRTKFESGTGWPSFWRPVTARALTETIDRSEYEVRVEVTCSRCGAHIGHVFQDGPPPTGLRYCTNSLSLKLDSEPTKPAPTTTKKTSQEVHSNTASQGIHRRGGRYQGTGARSTQSASKNSKSEAQKGAEPTTSGSS
jgi:peptide-methionine (R)-S-oxide reductase